MPSSVGRPSPGQRGENAAESSEGLLAGNDKTLETAVDKAKAMATAAGGWVLREGQAQGQRLAKAGRDWIAGYKESGEDASQLEASVTAGNTEVDDQEVISGKDASQLETSVTAGNTEVDNREVISGKDASQLETSVTAGNTEVDDPEVIASGASKTRDTCSGVDGTRVPSGVGGDSEGGGNGEGATSARSSGDSTAKAPKGARPRGNLEEDHGRR